MKKTIILFIILSFFNFAEAKETIIKAKKHFETLEHNPSKEATPKQISDLMKRFSTRNRLNIFKQIKEKQIRLDKKEMVLRAKENILNKVLAKIGTLSKDIEKKDEVKIKKIEAMQKELEAKMQNLYKKFKQINGEMEIQEQKNLNKLVKSFKSMGAKRAAKIVQKMNMDLVAKIMLRLPARNSGAILSRCDPKFSAKVGEKITKEKEKRKLDEQGKQFLPKGGKK